MSIEIRVPTLGESVTEATVATWFKKPGDAVAVDEMLCELETDKVTVEVPAPSAGTLAEIVAAEGSTVGVDALLASIAEGNVQIDAPAPAASEPASESAPAPTSAGGEGVDVVVPTLGESVTEATVASWFKATGDTVAADEMLCELETDKVSVEVPAPTSGVLSEILAAEGTTVEVDAKLAVISKSGGAAASAPAAEKPAEDVKAPAPTGAKNAPSAEKMMQEKGIDPASVQGTGRDGRIMKEDVMRANTAPKIEPPKEPAPMPRAPVAAEDESREERVKMTRLRQTIARRG